MFFNLDNGKVEDCGKLWRADNWIHFSIPYGMMSLLFLENEVLEFIDFLAQVPFHKDGFRKKTERYDFNSEEHDLFEGETTVNIIISDNTLVILNVNLKFIPAFMAYLYEHKDG